MFKTNFLCICFLVFGFFLFSHSAKATSSPNSLIGYWNLDETTGTTTVNSGTEGAVLNGTTVNMANPPTSTSSWTSLGKVNGAINFNGTNNTINFGSDVSVDNLFATDTTFSFWIKPTTCNSLRYIAGKSNGGPSGFYMYSSNGSCNPRLDVYHSTTRATYISAANSITPGQWNLVTYVWNATTKVAQIYVNGNEVDYSLQTPGVGTYVSDASFNLTFGTWGSGGASLYDGTLDELKIYNYARPVSLIMADSGYVTSASNPVTFVNATPYSASMLVQISGDSNNNFAEFKLKKVSNLVWSIQGLQIIDTSNSHQPYVLNNNNSVWEYAYTLGIAGDLATSTNWGFFGNGHGFETGTAFTISVDGTDVTSLPSSSVTNGSQLVITQARNVLLPKNGSTVVGTVNITHTLDANGLLVNHSHTYNSGYEIYDAYSAMLPTDHSTTTGINRSKIGTNPVYSIVNGNGTNDLNTISSSARQYSTNQPYGIQLVLPYGGPDVNGDWSHDAGAEKIWFYDRTDYGKIYVNWVSGGYANRIAATSSQHSTLYKVIKNLTDTSASTFTSPTASSISTSTATSTATISWNSAVNSSAQIFFGPFTDYGSSTPVSNTAPLTTSHSVNLTNLIPCAKYHYVVVSKSAALDTSTSTDQSLFTTGCTGQATPIGSAESKISTASGGNISYGNISLAVPAGFTSTTTSAYFQATQINNSQFFSSVGSPSGMNHIGNEVYVVKALVDSTSTISSFNQPITITFSYSSVNLSGIDESSLKIYRYDGSNWFPLSSCSVNTITKNIICDTSNFSDFAIFGKSQSSSSGGGGGGGGTGPIVINNNVTPVSSNNLDKNTEKLVNINGTFYFITQGKKLGITNPGILYSHGFDFSDAKIATPEENSLSFSGFLLPGNGALVKSSKDKTVYLISGQKRHSFISSKVFKGLGFDFKNVLEVTDPELQALPIAGLITNDKLSHLPGVYIKSGSTIYLISEDNKLQPFESIESYNSWNLDNSFKRVVKANAADLKLLLGSAVKSRIVN